MDEGQALILETEHFNFSFGRSNGGSGCENGNSNKFLHFLFLGISIN